MALTQAQFARLWQYASRPVPLAIVGGGRWGRVWASVAAQARGSCEGLVLVARTSPSEVRGWADSSPGLGELVIASSLDEACELFPPTAAIVASRPRDHLGDGLAALRKGLHVLVEKPISHDAESAGRLAAAATAAQRELAVGTEFAFLPAFHVCARKFDPLADTGTLMLSWEDPAHDVRHGALKSRHDEATLLVDLLPHALSVFRVFSPSAKFRIHGAEQRADRMRGSLILIDERGSRYELRACAKSDRRRRILEVNRGARHAVVDFAHEMASIVVDGVPLAIPAQLATLTSTLRLELGAFLLHLSAPTSVPPPIIADLGTLVGLHAELEKALSADPNSQGS